MKVLMTPNSIISLENVRRVEKRVTETKHTSYGKPYTLTHYEIVVLYVGTHDNEHIEFGTGESAKDLCEATFKVIFEKLSEN